ncbi:MAG: DUF882 domain-containing protein [Burkholderiales bacterium]|nr:DUF882 domain-containing protein [Burkholderiales bacterium]
MPRSSKRASEHFNLSELVFSQTAVRHNLDNTPDAQVVENLQRLCATLEQIRSLVGAPIHISSGYRAPAVNHAVGGASNSAHCYGLAADISVPGMTPLALAQLIEKSGIEYDQLIYEGTWVHVGLREGDARMQVLTAHFSQGHASYSEGLPGKSVG